jgi:hypothetical protein
LTAFILFVAAVGLVLVVRLTAVANQEAATTQAQINSLRQKEQSLMQSAEKVRNSLTPEQQQAVPAAHQLVDRRNFSWSKLLVDLESSLPADVRVSRIAVRDVTTQSGQMIAELDVAVFAKKPSEVTDMISKMHQEGVFQAELRAQNLQKGRGESGTEYELYVVYRARANFSNESVASAGAASANEVSR